MSKWTFANKTTSRAIKHFIFGMVAIAAIYIKTLDAGLFPVDDSANLYSPQIGLLPNARSIFGVFRIGSHFDFYPFRDLSYVSDRWLSGTVEFFHAHQIILFLELSTLIFCVLLSLRILPPLAALMALIWASNPVHSEMVGWISARKDLLALVYGAYATLFYLWGTEKKSRAWLGAAILCFVLSLFSKASLAALPWIGILQVFLWPTRFKYKNSIKALAFASLIALVFSIFNSWFYSNVNDVRYFYETTYRIGASAAAFGRALAGWFFPSFNVVDVQNSGHWLEYNKDFLVPGVTAWIIIVGAAIWGLLRRRLDVILFVAAFLAVYLPVSGLVFPHRQFYSVRYFEPAFLVTVFYLTGVLNGYLKKSTLGRSRTVFLIGYSALAMFLLMSNQYVELWSKPENVISAGRMQEPDSVQLKVLEFNVNRNSATWLQEHGGEVLAKDLERICTSDLTVSKPCQDYWSTRFADSLKEPLQVRQGYLDRATQSTGGEPPSAELWRGASQAFLDLSTGDIDVSQLSVWNQRMKWKTVPVLRLLEWFSVCQSKEEEIARNLIKEYLEAHLLDRNTVDTFRYLHVDPKYRAQLLKCI